MQTLLIAMAVGVAFIVAYHTYGRWLGRRIFELAADRVCPSDRLRDGYDYVPTSRGVVFGHHFTSIAATGPIVGPAIAVMWGWLPALLWVVLGSIFIGAVHDLGSLVVSLRSNGKTVGDVAGRVLNRRVRVLFLCVLFLALMIIIAIFGLVIANVFRIYPAAIFPCVVQIPIAVAIGLWLHRQGVSLVAPSMVALVVMYVTVMIGDENFATDHAALAAVMHALHGFNAALAALPVIVWVVVLLVYSYIASVLPVWVLLQPRDYINALQLIGTLALIVVGLVWAAFAGGAPPVEGAERQPLAIAAPMVNWNPEGAPMMLPFLFITIACGAISGFHCLVSSGTSSKQLKSETDAQFVGYGSMLTEGFLATIVILACVAGLGLGVAGMDGTLLVGAAAWAHAYPSWTETGGLGRTVGAFVDGAANFLKAVGIPAGVAVALVGVFVASFAATTLDTATRLQRYVVQELGRAVGGGGPGNKNTGAMKPGASPNPQSLKSEVALNPLAWLTNKYVATLVAVLVAGAMAALPAPGVAWSWQTAGGGGMILWPMFGATNQLMAGLAFLVIAFWLWRRRKPVWFIFLPLLFMLVIPAWAMLWQVFVSNPGGQPGWLFMDQPNWVLIGVALAAVMLEIWMIVEALLLFPKVRGALEGQQMTEVGLEA